MTNVFLWSTTAADNDDADGNLWLENMSAGQVNDSARDMMASIARFIKDQGGITTGGSSTAYTVTTNTGHTALTDGLRLCIRMHTASGNNPTLRINSLTAKNIKSKSGTNITSGQLLADCLYDLVYHQSDDCFYVVSGSAL